MSASDRYQVLQEVCGAVSRETFRDLEAFEQLFLKWAERINLVAPSTIQDLWNRHLLDSVQLLPLAPSAKHWVDLGSGGGFPGLVVAILLKSDSASLVDLVESNRKKAGFLQTVVGHFALRAKVHASRIEAAVAQLDVPDVVTARALAPLIDLLTLAEPFLSAGARALFHKGRDYQRELQESAELWSFDLLEHRSVVEPDSVVLEIANLRRRPD